MQLEQKQGHYVCLICFSPWRVAIFWRSPRLE
jgi:hypothetical protein